MNELGKTLMVVGLVLVGLGAVIWGGGGKFLGKLPGDIHVSRDNFSFHFPIVTCLLLSGLLSLIFWLMRR